MSFQQSASYVKACQPPSNAGSGGTDLPVVNMEVRAKPIIPDGGTAQEDYDQRVWFERPSFRLTLTLEWDFERTDYKPRFQNTLRDLVQEYMDGNGPLDFYVKYTGPTDTYNQGEYDGSYFCPKMIPDLNEEDAGLIFSDQAREKSRSIMLKSQRSNLLWSEVKFTFD